MDATKRETYVERNENPINRWINRQLDAVTEREKEKYIRRYATRSDGTRDEALAERIDYEVTRRSQMGREIDVLEPGRWTIYSLLLGVVFGALGKLLGEKWLEREMQISPKAVKNTFLVTAIGGFVAAGLMGGRILSYARFKSGLYAGAQTALATHHRPVPGPEGAHVAEGEAREHDRAAAPETIIENARWRERAGGSATPEAEIER